MSPQLTPFAAPEGRSALRAAGQALTLSLATARTLFDACPDVVFFAKDRAGRYRCANRTLLQRLGLADEAALLGRTPEDVFPEPLGASYHAQDLAVIESGRPLLDELERHLFPNHQHGWCLTRKLPLEVDGRVTGVVGISRDLQLSAQSAQVLGRLRQVIDQVQARPANDWRIGALAAMAHLSVAQFERQFARVMQIPPRRWLISVRLEAAMRALEAGGQPVAAIAQAAGFADHSAFTRSFRKHVGVTPSEYQRAVAGG
ncbi:AraC family transcriptional regulator [Aquabacterium humicola]|uniref:AraC family transcriptional regulator n=1 Tax=Aquabacterium humicola TaxID=3237377 RepID=UPI002542FFD7|nr:AraC family transcriptional regulator [Rubrivivax pictus]